MRMSIAPRRLLGVLCAWGLIAVAGCGGTKVVPVSGMATLDGKPLSLAQFKGRHVLLVLWASWS